MEFINQFLPTETLHAIGWTVIHSFWQAFAVALLLAAYLLAWQKTDARKRYIAGNMALVTMLLLAVGTFFYYLQKSGGYVPFISEEIMLGDAMAEDFSAVREASFFDAYFSQHMPLIVTVWALGLVFFMLKMLGGLLYIQRLKTRMTAPLPKFWQEKIGLLSSELRIARPVRLLESALAQAPMVVGWLKPVILLPMGAVNNLAPQQVEAILAHELAHIARHDYLLNLLQSCVEILFYFNPAVWWISANVRTERENCCDDIAVRLCGNSLAYAKALVSLQEMQLIVPALAMPFSKNKNQLLHRIQRILQPSQNKSNVMEKLSATLLLTVAVVLLSVQANTPFGNLITKVVSEGLPTGDAFAPIMEDTYLGDADTIPDGTRDAHFHYNDDRENIEVEMKDDKITFLKIDGKVIPAERYGEYEGRVREILANMPEPPEMPELPEMPEMPEMPEFPEMPEMPEPPSFDRHPAPPVPPAPPSRTRKIITQKTATARPSLSNRVMAATPLKSRWKTAKKAVSSSMGKKSLA
ncbi:MAG: M56 family metallopeptidase [Saprospiraceae bacterium]|nr:M56 family metallopeptidase [Saprospiraceae bacterium]